MLDHAYLPYIFDLYTWSNNSLMDGLYGRPSHLVMLPSVGMLHMNNWCLMSFKHRHCNKTLSTVDLFFWMVGNGERAMPTFHCIYYGAIPSVVKLVKLVQGELVSIAIVVLVIGPLSFDLWWLACEVCILASTSFSFISSSPKPNLGVTRDHCDVLYLSRD